MIEAPIAAPKFAAGWLGVVAASVPIDQAAPQAALIINIGGIELPAITSALGMIGVLAARFLALPKERSLGTPRFIVVSLLMLVAVEIWIVESRPGWLFAFVLAIGLGPGEGNRQGRLRCGQKRDQQSFQGIERRGRK